MTFDDDLDRAFRTLGDRLHDAISRELAASAAVVTAAGRGRPESAPESSAGSLRNHILAVDEAGSLTATLDALARAAGSYSARTALFLARRKYEAWRVAGFEPVLGVDGLALDADRAGIVAEAARRRQAVRTTDSTGLPHFAGRTAKAVAVPLVVGGAAVAVLYADAGAKRPEDVDEAAVEILCSHTSKALEARIAFMTARHVLGRAPSRQNSTELQIP